jgi:hypothetical protein
MQPLHQRNSSAAFGVYATMLVPALANWSQTMLLRSAEARHSLLNDATYMATGACRTAALT